MRLAPARSRIHAVRSLSPEAVAELASESLDRTNPCLSAQRGWSRVQRVSVAAIGVVLVVGIAVDPVTTAMVLVAVVTAAHAAVLWHRVALFAGSLRSAEMESVTDAEARGFPRRNLPVYTVLVPVYREPTMVGRVLEEIDRIEYPRNRLEVLLLVEDDDEETFEALVDLDLPRYVTPLGIAVREPRTKPKACNVGLMRARGSLVTIYDAEDRPDPLQLRRAAVAFSRLPPHVACLQARLAYHNAEQNMLTRWFTNEYDVWFRFWLPALVRSGHPIPLGGTSNHIRRKVLERIGAWDPYNVTEDADLGVRLARAGYGVRVLDSVTLEEANSDVVNWVKQRSRWYKGYLQTLLVHTREPRRLVDELGPRGAAGFLLFVGGTPLLALLNPVLWTLSLLYLFSGSSRLAAIFPSPLYHFEMLVWLAGLTGSVYCSLLAARECGRAPLATRLLLLPAYWVLMSAAAVKAAVQMVTAPSFWEKTVHGLDHGARTDVS